MTEGARTDFKYKTERNEEIVRRRDAGERWVDMLPDYGVSYARLRQIYEQHYERKRNQNWRRLQGELPQLPTIGRTDDDLR
jgi:Mor family transcriptional regulator